MTEGRETILPGTLYAALARMVDEGLVEESGPRTTTPAAGRRAATTGAPASAAPSRARNPNGCARCSTSRGPRTSFGGRQMSVGALATRFYALALRAFPAASSRRLRRGDDRHLRARAGERDARADALAALTFVVAACAQRRRRRASASGGASARRRSGDGVLRARCHAGVADAASAIPGLSIVGVFGMAVGIAIAAGAFTHRLDA